MPRKNIPYASVAPLTLVFCKEESKERQEKRDYYSAWSFLFRLDGTEDLDLSQDILYSFLQHSFEMSGGLSVREYKLLAFSKSNSATARKDFVTAHTLRAGLIDLIGEDPQTYFPKQFESFKEMLRRRELLAEHFEQDPVLSFHPSKFNDMVEKQLPAAIKQVNYWERFRALEAELLETAISKTVEQLSVEQQVLSADWRDGIQFADSYKYRDPSFTHECADDEPLEWAKVARMTELLEKLEAEKENK